MGITLQDAHSDAALCSDPFRGAGIQVPSGMDSPSATVAWEHTSVCAGRGWALSYQRLQWGKSSEKVFKVLFLSLCGCGGGGGKEQDWRELGWLRGVAKAWGLCCAASNPTKSMPWQHPCGAWCCVFSGHPSVAGDSLHCSIPDTSQASDTPCTPLFPVSSLTSPHQRVLAWSPVMLLKSSRVHRS